MKLGTLYRFIFQNKFRELDDSIWENTCDELSSEVFNHLYRQLQCGEASGLVKYS